MINILLRARAYILRRDGIKVIFNDNKKYIKKKKIKKTKNLCKLIMFKLLL